MMSNKLCYMINYTIKKSQRSPKQKFIVKKKSIFKVSVHVLGLLTKKNIWTDNDDKNGIIMTPL